MKAFGSQIIAEFVNCATPLLSHQQQLESLLSEGIERYGLDLKSMSSHQFEPAGVTAIAIIGASHVAIHTYPEARHLSLDIFTCAPGAEGPMQLMQFLKAALQPEFVRHKVLARGRSIDVQHKDYFTDFTQSGFNIRYQVEQELLNCRTDHQHLVIIDNQTFGRMLFLDHQLQIASGDCDRYTAALLDPLQTLMPESVLILGGGDGGVLNALLAQHPQLKKVTVLDIDAQVIAAAQNHLPTICGEAFADPRVEVVIAEANAYLQVDQSHQAFDAIIYDLTLEPEVVARENGEAYFETLFDGVSRGLKPQGVLSLQIAASADTRVLDRAKGLLNARFAPTHFKEVFIPSFCTSWIFAHAQKA